MIISSPYPRFLSKEGLFHSHKFNNFNSPHPYSLSQGEGNIRGKIYKLIVGEKHPSPLGEGKGGEV